MRALCLTLARLSLAGWVGAAALFVTTSIHEQTCPEFETITKDQLALIRFPDYYTFGFVLVAIAAATGGVGLCRTRRFRRASFLVTVLLSLGLMTVDYFAVYRPLQSAITPPGQARTDTFRRLHDQSKQINEAHLILSLVAAVIVAWPAILREERVAE